MTEERYEPVYIVFDGPPSEPGRFVEVETADGRSVSVGRWEPDPKMPGYWRLGPFLEAGPKAVEDVE